MKIQSALQSTLALTLAACAAPAAHANPFGNILHLHPHGAAAADDRISLTVYNGGQSFREVAVAGKTYEILPHRTLTIKGAAGTVVYAGCGVLMHKQGSVLFVLNQQANHSTVKLT